MIKKSTQLILSLALTLTCFVALAQNPGKIAGKITDKKNGETLIGATVLIEGSGKGAATNIDGNFIINGVAAGHYTISVKYIGYATKQISDVEVKAGAVTTLNVVLDQNASKTLKEVVVKGTYRQESVNSLYAAQKNNAGITDGITSETIKRSPDKSASEILRRVSGATVQDSKFVVVRGLSDRYNNAQLDGSNLPSTEPNRKAFSFDIVPANLIDNLVISKTATPNLPGDFAGGSVQIITKDIPDENFVTINAGLSYNTNTTFKNFQSGYRNSSDYFAFDNGARQLPSNFPSLARVQSGTLSQAQETAALRSLNPNYRIYNNNAFANQNYQLSIGRVADFKNNNRFGAIVALTYRNSLQNIDHANVGYNGYDFNDDKYRFSTSVGGLANFAYSFGKNRITLKNIYNRNFDDQFMYRTGYNDATSRYNKFYAFDLIQKGLFKTTLQGDHSFGEKNSKLTWLTSFSNVTNNQPDQRKTNYSSATENGVYSADLGTLGKQNSRYFATLNENVYGGQVDYSLPLTMFKEKATFKTGLLSQYRDRDFKPRFIGPILQTSAPLEVLQLPLNQIFSRSNIAQNYFELNDVTLPNDPYKANTFTNAGYLMLDNALSKHLRLVWGVRVEKFNLDLKGAGGSTAKLDDLDILPSANFTYSLTPKANLRFSYARTVARPELRELAVSGYYDYELLATVSGNPNLKRSQINNVDLRYEFYPSAGQIISVSAFYKNFTNAIESRIYDVNSTPDISFFNSAKANNYGLEFELRKNLEFIQPSLKNTTFYTNVAIIKSIVKDPSLLISFPSTGGERPMVGQAPYVINAGLLQTAFNNRFTFNVLYNRVGPRIFRAAGEVFPSVYENARDVIDLQLGMRVFKNRGEFKLNASDLLNQETRFYFKEPGVGYNPAVEGSTYNRYKLGQSISLSFGYSFK